MSKNNTKNKFAKTIIILVIVAMILPLIAGLIAL